MSIEFGWAGEDEAKRAWDAIGANFQTFNVFGATEYKRTTAWDCFVELGLSLDWFENQRQEIGDCFAAGTIIYGDETKPVEDVNVGDIVFDGDGKKTEVVSKQVKTSFNPMMRVTVAGGLPLEVTSDHLVLVHRPVHHHGRPVTGNSLLLAERDGAWRKLSKEAVAECVGAAPKWLKAAELEVGDYLLTPLNIESSKRPCEFPLDDWLLGFFVADGHASGGSVEFSTAKHDAPIVRRRLEDCGLGFTESEYGGRDAIRFRIHDKSLVDSLRKHFYDCNGFKVFPDWMIGNSEFADGLFTGDGHTTVHRKIFTSTSLSVIYGLHASWIAMGLSPTIGTVSRSAGTYANAKPLFAVSYTIDDIKPRSCRWGDYYAKRVSNVEATEGPHVVYDIGVSSKQHSVIANGYVAHNCVSWGAANAIMGTMAYEIVRLGDLEEFKRVFQPYLYAIGRLTPEGGNGRLGNQDGSLGSWQAAAVEKYGVLRSDFEGVPAYSGRVAKEWGTQKNGVWRKFIDEADNHLIKASARISSAAELKDAICNGYFCSIASNKGWSMRLRDSQGKSWFQGRDTWPHQMAIMAFDVQPMDCFYMKNQWGINAHGPQLDGPQGGGWRTADEIDSDLRNPGTECFAFSQFNGFPSNEEKPRNLYV